MTPRTALVLAGIAAIVAGLSLLRPSPREEAAVPAAPGSLPRVLDFGRDT